MRFGGILTECRTGFAEQNIVATHIDYQTQLCLLLDYLVYRSRLSSSTTTLPSVLI